MSFINHQQDQVVHQTCAYDNLLHEQKSNGGYNREISHEITSDKGLKRHAELINFRDSKS
jgi:hypothetical protein